MSATIRMTHATALVLHALSRGHVYGFDIMDATGLPGGTVYPALRRLESAGMVRSDWEDGSLAHRSGRPARKYYGLTGAGEAALAEATRRFRFLDLVARASEAAER